MTSDAHPSIDAAKQVIGDESVTGDDRVLTYLEPFYCLSLLTPAAAPPPELEARIAASGSDTAVEGPDLAPKAPARKRRWTRVFTATAPAPVVALILLLVVLVGSLVTNLVVIRGHGFRPIDAGYAIGTPAARDARGVALTDGEKLVLFATGLAELAPGYHYVAWSVVADRYVRLGRLTEMGSGNARLVVRGALFPEFLEVTIEGSARPSEPEGPAVLVIIDGATE